MASRGRWDPFREIASLQSELSRLAGTARQGEPTTRTWAPPVDVWETDEDFVFAFELPGVSEEKISIELEDGAHVVSGERLEGRYGPFSRTITVPTGTGEDDVTADYSNGILALRIAKPQAPQPRKIQIGKTK